jgi:hypothetical protein
MDKTTITKHLYNDSVSQALTYVSEITNEETLFVYAHNYNWDNGFDAPKAILQNSCCTLSIALLIFYRADGIIFLQDKKSAEGTKEWIDFVSDLYNKILANEFTRGNAAFNPGLSKVEEFKLRKSLSEKEKVFIEAIEGTDYYINL